ncbi:MAG: hypothetical protein ACYSW3_02035 [Planctomycetota bacterium]|jgi:hypothetical protein
MQKLAQEILEEILRDDSAWDKGTKRKPKEPELRYRYVVDSLHEAWNHEWYRQVLWPRYFRYTRLLYAISDEKFRETHFAFDEDEIYLSECWHCQQKLDAQIDLYLWKYRLAHPEWELETPSEDEVLATGIRPQHQTVMF